MIEDAYVGFIKRYPGCTLNKLQSEFSGIDRDHIKKALVPLEINGTITRVGTRYWETESNPQIKPKLNSIFYSIQKRKHGVTIDQLADQLNLSKTFVTEEIKFLFSESKITIQDGFIYVIPISHEENSRSRFSIGELQFLSRNELLAIASRLLETATYLMSEYETIQAIIEERKQEIRNEVEKLSEERKSAEITGDGKLKLNFRGTGYRH